MQIKTIMKKIILCAAILLSCLTYKSANAQLRVSLGFNIGSQPEWGPVGYDHADYYYMPDIDAYYDVPAHQYVYMQNNAWIRGASLPPRYANYDLYHGYKVVVNQRNPWEHNADIRARYSSYRGRRDQQIIRDNREDKYRNHWNGDRRDGGDRGNGYDRGRGNDRGNGYDRGRGNDRGNGKDNGHGNDRGNGNDKGRGNGNGPGEDRGHGRP